MKLFLYEKTVQLTIIHYRHIKGNFSIQIVLEYNTNDYLNRYLNYETSNIG